MIVLGVETSCDETAAAICSDGFILSSIVSSQLIHSEFGGVVPELASREHELFLNSIVHKAIQKAGIKKTDIEGIAVTRGPGLAGALLAGACFSKGFAQGLDTPIIGINHLEAHIFANFLADPNLEFPFVCLLVSGGHTQLWLVERLGGYTLLGSSRDDAAGEAFDKGARILGLGYPGGPEIEECAKGGNQKAVDFPRAFINNKNIEFSFSGLKTALLYYMDTYENNTFITKADISASYQQAIVDVLVTKLKQAVADTAVKTCVIAGGVAANKSLRRTMNDSMKDIRVLYPDLTLCTDNGAMVAYLGELYLTQGVSSAMDFDIDPNLKLA
ncbi:MAG: tRNA (adenosine(37)-N6)-threonylcarbamoyltransferase complex transferase subunit TsaD [Fidelibacterota bacterium]